MGWDNSPDIYIYKLFTMKATEKKLQSKLTEYVLSWINSDDRFNDALELMELIRSEVGDRESESRWLGRNRWWLLEQNG